MSNFENFPRDVQIEIIKRFDIEARVRCGIIGKLKVPTRVEIAIAEKARKLKAANSCSFVFLGTPARYHIAYTEAKRCWDVFHISLTGSIAYHQYDEAANRWMSIGGQGI